DDGLLSPIDGHSVHNVRRAIRMPSAGTTGSLAQSVQPYVTNPDGDSRVPANAKRQICTRHKRPDPHGGSGLLRSQNGLPVQGCLPIWQRRKRSERRVTLVPRLVANSSLRWNFRQGGRASRAGLAGYTTRGASHQSPQFSVRSKYAAG